MRRRFSAIDPTNTKGIDSRAFLSSWLRGSKIRLSINHQELVAPHWQMSPFIAGTGAMKQPNHAALPITRTTIDG
jgi:hypothetical protein